MMDSTASKSCTLSEIRLGWWLMVRLGDGLAGVVRDFRHSFERHFRVCLVF